MTKRCKTGNCPRLRKFSQKRCFFWVPGRPGIRWKIKKMQRISNAGRAPSSSAELGQQSKSLIFELGRPRPSLAEVSQARPSSAGLIRGCRWSLGPKNVIFPAPDDQKMSSSIFMIWNSLVTNQFELATDLHSPRSNGIFEWRLPSPPAHPRTPIIARWCYS